MPHKRNNVRHTPDVLYIYQHVMFTMQCMQMFNLVYVSYISTGIQSTVCTQKVHFAKKYWLIIKLCLHFISPNMESDLFL